jgi:enoyl-CoA hydratase/carnithine racemase
VWTVCRPAPGILPPAMPRLQRERVEPGIELLRLDRPDQRNALDSATLGDLNAVLDELSAEQGLRAFVLSTTDTRALCAGADVSESLDAAAGLARMEAFARMYAAAEAFPAPTICVCVGNVVGAGAELAAGCDLRVGGDNLKLAWAGARLGVPVGPARLAPLIGLSRARDLVLTGRVVGMQEAHALGFLNRTAPVLEAEATALALAREIAANDLAGVRRLRSMFRAFEGMGPAERVARENEMLVSWQRHGAGLPSGAPQRARG